MQITLFVFNFLQAFGSRYLIYYSGHADKKLSMRKG